jgi:FkbM family methyltransferase
MAIKRWIRDSLYRAGWSVRRINPAESELAQLVRQLFVHQIDVVFDVGANTGQFAEGLRHAGFLGRIVSFEASATAHATLIARARYDTKWIVAPRVALGDRKGVTTLNLARNSVSSSVLHMLPSHINADPKSRYVGSEPVDLRTLDDVGMTFVSPGDRIFLKLDVQGFEHKVLQGARLFLAQVQGMQVELSLVPLYEGERLFHPMLHDLEEYGYDLWSLVPGFADPATCRLLQLDAIFFKAKSNCAELPSVLQSLQSIRR